LSLIQCILYAGPTGVSKQTGKQLTRSGPRGPVRLIVRPIF